MNRANYREHRIRGSLERTVGEDTATPDELRRLVRRARLAGVVVFLRDDLDRLPWGEKDFIEAVAKRLYGDNERRTT